ncbi:hypothetical protein B0H14DRAFT_3495942 [Mycena olivaceomarginata]|nr:hypothetical protein B0H14DRAFT_3495942 [Mycena olivaceomarginata]
MAARRQASARYREKNLEEEREKARTNPLRFSYLEKIREQDDLAEDTRARAREASRRFRHNHGPALAHRQRILQMEYASLDHRS